MGHRSAALTLSVYAVAMEWEDDHAARLVALPHCEQDMPKARSAGAFRAHKALSELGAVAA